MLSAEEARTQTNQVNNQRWMPTIQLIEQDIESAVRMGSERITFNFCLSDRRHCNEIQEYLESHGYTVSKLHDGDYVNGLEIKW